MNVRAGVAKVEVEVPPGTAMAGFAARTGPSLDVHDALNVRALVLEDTAVVTADVCGVHERTVAQVEAELGDAVRSIVLVATHTHSGPCVSFERLGHHEPVLHDELVGAIVAAVRQAVSDRRPVEVRYAETGGLGIAKNRRHRERRSDPPAQALCFTEPDGAVVAWLVVYPCHPVVLDAANRSISGDYAAVVRDRIEAQAPGALCLFATGAAGDMNTGHRVEDSYSSAGSGRRTFAEAARIGRLIGDAVLAAPSRQIHPEEIRTAIEEVELALVTTSAEQARRERDGWRAELAAGASAQRAALLRSWLDWADRLLSGAYEPAGRSWRGAVTAIGVGQVTLVALPGEPFLASAERVASSGEGTTIVLGYANGCPGYFPPADEYPHGGYEVTDAHRYYGMPGPFASGSAERLEDAAVRAIEQVRR